MGLSGALSSAISALASQSTALSMISDNISNSDTTGYKTTSAMFDDLVTASSSSTSYAAGGVTVSGRANITQQGLLAATTNATDVAIQGSGFFVVTDGLSGGNTFYTRNGAFTTDNQGYLVNNGYYLEGWPTDSSGNANETAAPVPINTQAAASIASATANVAFDANLPADATTNTSTTTTPTTGSSFTSSMTVYDSLGNPASISITWTKTGTNTWSAQFGDPTSPSDTSTSLGTTSTTNNPITLTFNSDGSLSGSSPSPASIAVTWNDGSSNSTINLDLSKLTQNASGETTPSVDVTSITPDGYARGTLSSISVSKNTGIVDATYSNGETIPIYKIAVATFTDPNGLSAGSDGMYSATATSGNATLHGSGENGAGTVYGSELESSTTDTSGQFSNMISAQQAYSAASQVVTTVNKMYDTLISAMR
ncbi:flagellar hook protein FlgE [Bradyrhizobium sp. ARR65]|uniref:flagellar hook protein FlgE n=1 Tax=Bradyrhizobium sp. ARR65 TaxID=1040989 RepID=UPI0004645355|nr:flagellar hook protein FlgE [Bradyrhizobium sp. ARR65]